MIEPTRVIGKPVLKSDAWLKARGTARFAADIRPAGGPLLCGKILRSPHPHATILSVDTSRAAALPGVYAVVSGRDIPPNRIGTMLRDRFVLARDKVRFVGEPVAAVAAVDEAAAVAALKLIQVEYELLPAVFTPEEALADGAPLVHEDLASYAGVNPKQCVGNQCSIAAIEDGDVEAAFAQADVVVEGTFTVHPVHHGYIETKSCVAEVDGGFVPRSEPTTSGGVVGKLDATTPYGRFGRGNGKITIWAAARSPFRVREMTSLGLGLPLSKIRIITATIGGSFGGKQTPAIEPICALLALKAGRPVRLVLDGNEELATHFTRQHGTIKLKLAARRDGKLLGIEGEILYNAGAYCNFPGGGAGTCGNLQGAYNIPAVRLRGRTAFTNSLPTGPVRAPSMPQSMFAIESAMDELAERLGIDRFELRRINQLKEGDAAPSSQYFGWPRGVLGKAGLSETIESAAAYVAKHMSEAGSGSLRIEQQFRHGEGQLRRGIGIACGVLWGQGAGNPSKCIVKLNEDGSATLLTGIPDNGSGQHTVLAQVVAEILGLAPEEVSIVAADTDLTPADPGPGGSRGTVRASLAAKFAAEDVRRQLLAIAAGKLEANPTDLEIGDRRVNVKGSPDRGISLAALASAAEGSSQGAIVGTGSEERERWLDAARSWPKGVADEASFCTHAAKVEVDAETGEVTVLQYVAAQDVGRALNAMTAAGQIHAAVANGIGYALHEELSFDQGQPLNADFANYRLPLADVVPTVEAIMVECPTERGPFGARGIGESSITPVAAAIANAIYDAVGVRVRSLPITPEKLLRAMREKEGSSSHSK